MESIKCIAIGILVALGLSFGFLFGMDLEVAKADYNENVKQCKLIEGCLFDINCEHYNEMIEGECND